MGREKGSFVSFLLNVYLFIGAVPALGCGMWDL